MGRARTMVAGGVVGALLAVGAWSPGAAGAADVSEPETAPLSADPADGAVDAVDAVGPTDAAGDTGAAAAIEAAVPNTAEGASPAVAFDGTNYLVVWEDYRTGDADIYAARVTSSGTILSSFAVYSNSDYNDVQPAVAFNGTTFLVTWQAVDSWGSYVRAIRVAQNGTVLGSSVVIDYYVSGRPRVAAVGNQWLVVWTNGDAVYAGRVSSSGAKLDGWGFTVSNVTSVKRSPTVFAHQGRWVVAWQDFRAGNGDVYYTMVTTSGMVTKLAGRQVTSSASDDFSVNGQSVGAQALLTWTNSGNIRGARIDTSSLLDPVDGFGIATGTAQQRQASIARVSTTQWVVVWSERAANWNVRSRTVNTSAGLGAVQTVSAAAGDQIYPVVTKGSTNLLTVWQDGRAAATRGSDIYGRLLSSLGAPTGADIPLG